MSGMPTVPIASNGLEGWTSCCEAAVTYSGDGYLCCKKCWSEVDTVSLPGEAGVELGKAISAAISDDSYHEAILIQRRLLAAQTSPLPPVKIRPAMTIHFQGEEE